MTNESPTCPAIPPPKEQHTEHQPLPQIPVNSVPISAAPPSLPQAMMEVFASTNRVLGINEIDEPSYFNYLDSREYADKYRSYESEFKQMLMAKYFSGRNADGVNVYEEMTTIDSETIKSTKWPRTRCYADPDISYADRVQRLDEEEDEEEDGSVDSASAEISPGEISNGGTV